MFIDYLRLTYLIPWADALPDELDSGYHLAKEYHARSKIAGEVKIDNSHRTTFANYPEGLRVVMEWGGSQIPIDVHDFLRRFRKYKDWTISRLDLADNIEHLSKRQIRTGQSKKVQHWEETAFVDDKSVPVWTGTAIGKRGAAGSYFRAYDARKHEKGKAAKISRFGNCDFWRVEYELSREFFRRKGIIRFGELDFDRLQALWANETFKKGVWFEGTSQYMEVDERPLEEVEEEMAQKSRFLMIEQMVRKLDLERLDLLSALVDECRKVLAESPEQKKARRRRLRASELKANKERLDSVDWPNKN